MLATADIQALSLTGCHWRLRDADERTVSALVQQRGLTDLLARLLVARGIGTEEAEAFLAPSLKHSMPDPSSLLDMDAAADRLASAIMGGEKVGIFGDYDVDGATSSALLARYLRACGQEAMVYIPDRMLEGYGPNTKALLGLQQRGASVVITVDCGTLAFEPLEAAFEAGLDVIVIDHHIGEARKPKAYAIVNPNRLDETSPHRQLAAVGVAFLFIVAVNRCLRQKGWFSSRAEPDLKQWLDIVALGTVCDVVPLTGVNRALVAQGLKVMANRQNIGIRALLDVAGVDSVPGTYHAGFVLGPRVNAGGRVGRSDLGVRLLSTEDSIEAAQLAKDLDQYNIERKTIEADMLEEALQLAERVPATMPVMVVHSPRWHIGVIGIVAARLKERYNKPVAVIATKDGIGKASARSVSGFDFGAAVIAAREHGVLEAGGGHAMAAGFTVKEELIPQLVAFFTERLKDKPVSTKRELWIDAHASIAGITPDFANEIEQLGPFGQGNPQVRLVLPNVVNIATSWVGQDEQHVRTILCDESRAHRLPAVAFRVAGTKLADVLFSTRNQRINVAGHVKAQEWMGKRSVSFQIEDVAAAV